MAQLEGIADDSNETNNEALPSLEQWMKQGKITQNLYNKLSNEDPPYNVELLLLMSKNDIKDLKNELGGIKTSEILQLINLISKIPNSQVYNDLNNDNQRERVVYLTPQQHKTINNLTENLTNISQKLENIKKSRKCSNTQRDNNILLVNATFDELIKLINKRKLEINSQITNICQRQNEQLSKQESSLKKLYQTTFDIKTRYEKFTKSRNLTTSQQIQQKQQIESVIDGLNQATDLEFKCFDLAIDQVNTSNGYNVKLIQGKQMKQMVNDIVCVEQIDHDETNVEKKEREKEKEKEKEIGKKKKEKADNSVKIAAMANKNWGFVESSCCNQMIIKNSGKTCIYNFFALFRPWHGVYFGHNNIGIGVSTFDVTIDAGIPTIGFVPASVKIDLHSSDFISRVKKYGWIIFRGGGYHCKSEVNQQSTFKFSTGDTLSIKMTVAQGRNNCRALLVNKNTQNQHHFVNMTHPLRLIFGLCRNAQINNTQITVNMK